MAEEQLERVYTIPLRSRFLAVPRNKRARRSLDTIRDYIARHMKTDREQVWIDQPVNELIWERGAEKPPPRIRVKAIRFEDGVVEVSLPEQ